MSRFKCNGYASEGLRRRTQMTEEQVSKMIEVFSERRKLFEETHGEEEGSGGKYYFGARFNDKTSILNRILSQTTVEDMLAFPVEWTDAALDDCASADHWYMFEKRWD